MSNLQIFKNSEFGEIRTVTKDNEPWFVASDICKNYCKYPVIYKPTHIEDVDDDYMGRMFDEKCEQCPFRKLGL